MLRVGSQTANHVTFFLTVSLCELYPPTLIFDSDAEKVENRSISARAAQELPKVEGTYGVGKPLVPRKFRAAATPKGGMDGNIYKEVLSATSL